MATKKKKTEVEARLTTPEGLEPLAGEWDALCYLKAEDAWYAAGGKLWPLARPREYDYEGEAPVTLHRWAGGWQEVRVNRNSTQPRVPLLPVLTPYERPRYGELGMISPFVPATFGPADADLFTVGCVKVLKNFLKKKVETPLAVAGVPDKDLEWDRPTVMLALADVLPEEDHTFWSNYAVVRLDLLTPARVYRIGHGRPRGYRRAGEEVPPAPWRLWVWEGDDWALAAEGTSHDPAGPAKRARDRHYRQTHCQS